LDLRENMILDVRGNCEDCSLVVLVIAPRIIRLIFIIVVVVIIIIIIIIILILFYRALSFVDLLNQRGRCLLRRCDFPFTKLFGQL